MAVDKVRMRAERRERDIEADVVRWAKANGWYARKFKSPGHRGVPDRLFIKDGRVVFIELKATYQKPRRDQEIEMKAIREAGVECYWTDDADEGIAILRDGRLPRSAPTADGAWIE
jgi:hypothetical protein